MLFLNSVPETRDGDALFILSILLITNEGESNTSFDEL